MRGDFACSFANQMHGDIAFAGRPAMLEKIDALPGPKRQPAIDDRDREIRAGQSGADVCRHVIRALLVVEIAAFSFRSDVLKEGLKVGTNFRRRIFLNEQSRGGMPAEKRHQSISQVLTAQPVCDFGRDLRETATFVRPRPSVRIRMTPIA